MARYQQGRFQPRNPKKYKGNPCGIIYRSSWELNFFSRLDNDPNVIQWASEEIAIPYLGIDGKRHRYFPDLWIKTKSADGKINEMLVEIKPNAQSIPPTKKANNAKANRRYINEAITYETNSRKWAAAEALCKAKGWVFKVVGEKELGLK